jgi:hypothetical protein
MSEQQISKSEQWYFHPNEIVRMLRYYQLNMKFDNTVDYTPKYSEHPSLGVVIGTYGSVPYIDLQLHYLVNVNGIKNVLVCDDCSDKQTELKQLCDSYGVDFYSSQKKLFNKEYVGSVGDTNVFYEGLKWAKNKNIELLVKLSRRLIPCKEWKTEFLNLVKCSDATTFGSYCTKDPFNFRTECVGMHVDTWYSSYPMQCLKFTIENELCIFAEFWFHELAKTLSGNNYSEKWLKYIQENKFGYLRSGYAHWYDISGTCRFNSDNRTNVLWHQFSSTDDYYNKCLEIFGTKYQKEDFV